MNDYYSLSPQNVFILMIKLLQYLLIIIIIIIIIIYFIFLNESVLSVHAKN